MAGQVAIITGASRGIGRAAAAGIRGGGRGGSAGGAGRAALAANVAEITSMGGRALAVPTDVADEDSAAQLFAQTEAVFGPVTILVNAAGAVANRPFAEMEPGHVGCCPQYQSAWDVPLLPRRVPDHAAHGGGVIVNFSSLSGVPKVEKFPGLSAYVVSKYGVAGLSEILAVEGRPHNIRVVAISPGAVDTEMLRRPRRTSRRA